MPKSKSRRKPASLRPRPPDPARIRMPSGPDVTLTGPPPELLAAAQAAGAGEMPWADYVAQLGAWLERQPPAYQRYALDMMRRTLTAAGRMAEQAEAAGGRSGLLGADASPVVARFLAAVQSGGLDLCRHVRRLAPVPATWVPWAPGKIRCGECTALEFARISGTKEDRRCDQCGTIQPKITTHFTA